MLILYILEEAQVATQIIHAFLAHASQETSGSDISATFSYFLQCRRQLEVADTSELKVC